MDDQELGARVRAVREQAGVSARQMAKAIGMDAAAYSRSETGSRGFRATELVAIANRLDQPLDALVQRPAADTIAAGRRAGAAGEEAVAAVGEWLSAVARALALAMPPAGILAIPAEKRPELHAALAATARTVLPRPYTVAVAPGMRVLLDDLLRVELPRLVRFAEEVEPPAAE